MTRRVFKHAVDIALIPKAVKFGPKFTVPSKSERRIEKARKRPTNGKLMFEASEILAMLDKAGVPLKAMILLGINGGLGSA